MCGLCFERLPIEVAKSLVTGSELPTTVLELGALEVAYLQEDPDLAKTFNKLTKNSKNEIIDLQKTSAEPFDVYLLQHLALCRIMETLIENGFQSDKYQRLLKSSVALRMIRGCSNFTPLFDGPLFSLETAWRTIFSPGFYLDEVISARILSNPTLLSECQLVLQAYADQWHPEFVTNGQSQEIPDYAQLRKFDHVFLSVYFSFLLVGKHYPTHSSIYKIVNQFPAMGGLDGPLDFWLQRKAAISLYKGSGLTNFWPFKLTVRSTLTYYLLITGVLDKKCKEQLTSAILNSGQYDLNEDWSHARERMSYSSAPYHFIMQWLENSAP